MGIFSLFGKKDERGKPAEQEKSRAKRPGSTPQAPSADPPSTLTRPAKRDPLIARATALKIDAIESEMSSEFNHLKPKTGKSRAPAPAPAKPVAPAASPAKTAAPAPQPAGDMGTTTGFLMETQGSLNTVGSTATAAIEEAAILYANGQTEVVEQMLEAAVADEELNQITQTAWLMLFDLYQLQGKQQEFERLSLAYVERFETSPPGWHAPDAEKPQPAGAIPMVSFSGKLDESCAKLIERLRNLAAQHRTLRLEFVRISAVTPAGCGLLLERLQLLQKYEHDLILVGAPELAEKIRATLTPGQRGDNESSWLLLLELLRLLNREQEFEETSMDYCVTFEVSPPAFVAPQSKITTAAADSAEMPQGFPLPPVVEGNVDTLVVSIAAYSDQHEPAVIDCSRLQRVDFNAAGRLLTGLAPFCGAGKVIEFHHVNHLVAGLFTVIGLSDIVRVLPRRN